MRRSSLSLLVIALLSLVLAMPTAAAPDAPVDAHGEPSLVSLVLGWWTSIWDAVSPMIDPNGPPADQAGDEVSPVIDPNGPPADQAGDEVSPMIDPNGGPGTAS
ncbi:MAG: hypothetical protein AAGE94_01870 [Acidobacteriota bacterium]